MKIKHVEIINFKSIKNIVIPFQEYGSYSNKSKTCVFVGLNETGKSSILEALKFINTTFKDIEYDDYCFKPALDNNNYVELYIEFELNTSKYWVDKMVEKCGIPKEIAQLIKFKEITKNIYLNNESEGFHYSVTLEEIDLHEYILEEGIIYKLRDRNAVEEKISQENASTFLNENQKLLEQKELEEILSNKLQIVFTINTPRFQIWKPQPEYLINTPINLEEFMEDNTISQPLRNIFHIGGYKDKESIKTAIDRALKKQEKSDELKDKLSEAVTKHLNKIWKEHKIKIVLSINGSNCQVFIEDKDKRHNYFKMEQRSDGFQQFVSLILSLSAQNETAKLKNHVILIDEPEVHLHPSGVRYMRDELLKIGKNNHVFIATHSHYMIDTNCQERHWIVNKEKSETTLNQISEATPIEDDDVLVSAFGLSLFKELLPKVILVVEGGGDKHVILHLLKKLKSPLSYSIKSAGGASKAPGIASLLSNESIPAYILFDDDKEGRDNKKRILDNYKETYSSKNTFTLRDLAPSIPKDSTIEDLMPTDFVKSFFEDELKVNFTIDESKAIILQLKQQNDSIKQHKDKLESLKIKLSKKFCEDFDSVGKIENDAPKMKLLIEELHIKWTSEEDS